MVKEWSGGGWWGGGAEERRGGTGSGEVTREVLAHGPDIRRQKTTVALRSKQWAHLCAYITRQIVLVKILVGTRHTALIWADHEGISVFSFNRRQLQTCKGKGSAGKGQRKCNVGVVGLSDVHV